MVDVGVVDLGVADGVDELLLQHCALDEVAQQALHLLLVRQRRVHLVRFLLQRGHLALYGLQMVLEVIEHVLELLHYAVRRHQLLS